MTASGFHPTTIYLWLISLAASKELSILLLKLLKCKSNRYSDFILPSLYPGDLGMKLS